MENTSADDTSADNNIRPLRGAASPLSPRNVESQLRAALAARKRIEGKTFQQIADECGYDNRANAHRAVSRFLKELPAAVIEEELPLALERLDDLYAKLAPQSDDPAAARAALAIIKERANLLGMHAPQKFQVDSHHAIERVDSTVEFMDLMSEVAGRYALAQGQPALDAQLVDDNANAAVNEDVDDQLDS